MKLRVPSSSVPQMQPIESLMRSCVPCREKPVIQTCSVYAKLFAKLLRSDVSIGNLMSWTDVMYPYLWLQLAAQCACQASIR
jgi:hypothetical protein